jgi:DNA-binding CsgD family transcriptional regulator
LADLLDVVEAAYAPDGDFDAWLRQLARAAAPIMNDGFGVCAALMTADGAPLGLAFAGKTSRPDVNAETYLRGAELTDQDLIRMGLQSGPVSSLVTFLGPQRAAADPSLQQVVHPLGARDVTMVVADDMAGHHVALATIRREVFKPKPSTKRAWSHIAAHLGAGLRLRSPQLRGTAPAAIFATNGRVQHAEEGAKDAVALSALSRAVQASEQARGKLRRVAPEEAIQLWEALVSGRWSLVDHFDSDGRRYVVARENSPNPTGPHALSPRQKAALTLRARGHSLKFIGYELGLSVPTISAELRQAMQKLGVRSAVELSALYGSAR